MTGRSRESNIGRSGVGPRFSTPPRSGAASNGTGRLPAYGTGRPYSGGGGRALGHTTLNPYYMGSNPGDSTIRSNIMPGATFSLRQVL